MYKEKNVLQTSVSAGEYLAPTIKVKELKCRRVICASYDGATENMNLNSDNGSNWI